MRAFGLVLCFILFLKRHSSGICLVNVSLQCLTAVLCRGILISAAEVIRVYMLRPRLSKTMRPTGCEGKRLSCCGCWDHSREVLMTFD